MLAVCLDRFGREPSDPADDVLQVCNACGAEIYRGQTYYIDGDGEPVCARCVEEYAEREELPFDEVVAGLIEQVAGEEDDPWA